MRTQTDNDFDKLFKDKLEGIEIVPSERVWANIAGDIKLPVRDKKRIPLIWLAAASVSLLFVLSLLIIPGKEPIKLQASIESTADYKVVTAPVKVKSNSKHKLKGIIFLNKLASMKLERDRQVKSYKLSAKAIANNLAHRPLLAKVDIDPATAILKEDTAVLSSVPSFMAMRDPVANQEINQHKISKVPIADTDYQDAKTGIRSVGDLVNFVVRQVDHRSEKIIEFTDHDEGSSVSGINLGLIKIRSKQNELKPN